MIPLQNQITDPEPLTLHLSGDRPFIPHVLRLDRIHPVISGNKWFKLYDHLDQFSLGDFRGILTFGGAWSNHLAATAHTCALQNIQSVGVIRGEKPLNLSTTLRDAADAGMKLIFINRHDYREASAGHLSGELKKKFAGFYIIPEGGRGPLGEKGAARIMDYVHGQFTHIACALGTGTMFRGVGSVLKKNQELIGIPVIRGWKETLPGFPSRIFTEYHFGGFARYNDELIRFMNNLFTQTSLPTDFVYTGKLLYALADLFKKGILDEHMKILIIHSGGLQGNRSLKKGTLMF